MRVVVASLASVVLVSLVSLIGVLTLSLGESGVRRLATFFVSFAVGALLGDAFLHLIPDALSAGSTFAASLLMLGGMMLFFMVEKLLRHTHGVLHAHHHGRAALDRPELAAINILGDAIHNFIDGVLIGASYLAGWELGISTTFAVLLHEIPQELGDFGILIHSGMSVKRALWANLASASVAVLGTALVLLGGAVAKDAVVRALLPVAAGGLVYLASADLIPELQHDRSLQALGIQSALISLGIGVMALLKLVEG